METYNKDEDDSEDIQRIFFQALKFLSERGILNCEVRVTILAELFLESKDTSLFHSCESWTLEEWSEPLRLFLFENDEEVCQEMEDENWTELSQKLFNKYRNRQIGNAFVLGETVLSFLSQDEDWHEAEIVSLPNPKIKELRYQVKYFEYGFLQFCAQEDLRPIPTCADDLDSKCALCDRAIKLTFHHLVPREIHSRVLKQNGKELAKEIEPLYQAYLSAGKIGEARNSRRIWLGGYGIVVCRSCHSQIHRVESNDDLSLRFNTLSRILSHPEIEKWCKWARKRKI